MKGFPTKTLNSIVIGNILIPVTHVHTHLYMHACTYMCMYVYIYIYMCHIGVFSGTIKSLVCALGTDS